MRTVCIYNNKNISGIWSAGIVKCWWLIKQNKLSSQTKFLTGEDIEVAATGILNFISYQEGNSIPDLLGYDEIILCNVNFSKEEMFKLKDKLIWLDNRINAIHNVYGKNNWIKTKHDFRGIQGAKFLSDCELVYNYFFPNSPIPKILDLKEFEGQNISNYNEAYELLRNISSSSKKEKLK